MKEYKEASIIINGKSLNNLESMTIRVAIENFAIDLRDGLGNDECGKRITKLYLECMTNIRKLLYKE